MEKPISVLMVDDEVQFRETTSRILQKKGYQTTMAASGEEAVAIIEKTHHDVVILDIKMAGMDGLEALKKIKTLRPETRVIMLTGHGTIQSARESLTSGAADYLNKPCDISLLSQKINALTSGEMAEKPGYERLAKDIMILADNYTSVSADASIKEALEAVMKSIDGYIASSRLIYTVHRSVLVFDAQHNLVGVLSVRTLIESLRPGYLTEARPSMDDSMQYSSFFWSGLFTTQARKLAHKKVREVMNTSFVRVDSEANLMAVVDLMTEHKARRVIVMDKERVLGVVREQELFFELANILL
ncbi:response regulator [bacterium]|nr:response regulator [bacterium]